MYISCGWSSRNQWFLRFSLLLISPTAATLLSAGAVLTWGWYANTGFSYRIPPPRTRPNSGVKVDLKAGINVYRLSQLEDPIDGPDTKHGLGLQIGPQVVF